VQRLSVTCAGGPCILTPMWIASSSQQQQQQHAAKTHHGSTIVMCNKRSIRKRDDISSSSIGRIRSKHFQTVSSIARNSSMSSVVRPSMPAGCLESVSTKPTGAGVDATRNLDSDLSMGYCHKGSRLEGSTA